MYQFFKIASIANVLSEQRIQVEDLLNKFIDETHSLEQMRHFSEDILGKKTLYRYGENDSILKLATKASCTALEKSKLQATDIDGIIFTGITPEHFSPTTALAIHQKIGCRDNIKFALDMNSNCVGMVVALYEANAMMCVDETINHILIVDSGYLSSITPEYDPVGWLSLSDSSTAMIISRRETIKKMDYGAFQNTNQINRLVAPVKGFTHFIKNVSYDNFIVQAGEEELDCEMELTSKRIKDFLQYNNIRLEEIKAFCFSQYVKKNIDILIEELSLEEENVFYVGDQIGYTGPSSPFVALQKALETNKLQKDDFCLLWTIASGSQHALMLLQI